MSKDVTIEEKINVKVLALAAVGAAIFAFIARSVGSFVLDYYVRDYTFALSERTGIIGSPYFYVILMLLLMLAIPPITKRVGKKTLGYLYINALVSVTLCGVVGAYWNVSLVSGARILYQQFNRVLPSFWAPPAGVIAPANMGRLAVPWADWAIPIAFWILIYYSLSLTMMSGIAILRKQWLTVENVPFPMAQANIQYVDAATNPQMDKTSKRMLLIGILLGFLYFFPPLLRTLLPWFPDIYGWTGPPYLVSHPGSFDLVRGAPGIARTIVGLGLFNINIAEVALYYLIPLSTSLTTWVFYLLFYIVLPQIAYTMGYYSNLPPAASGGARNGIINTAPPLYVTAVVYNGVLPALAVFNIVLNWRYIRDTLKAALGRAPEGFRQPGEVSYRTLYGIFSLGIVLFLALIIGSGAEAWQAITVTVILMVFGFGLVRVYGLSTMGGSGAWDWNPGLTQWMNPGITTSTNMTTAYFTVQYWGGTGLIGAGGPMFFGQGFTMGDSFTMARHADISPKMAFWTAVVSHIVAVPVAIITLLWLWYTFGWLNTPASKMEFAAGFISHVAPETGVTWMNLTFNQPLHVAVGWIIAGVFSYARATFLWFPFDAVGIFIAGTAAIYNFGWWSSFLIAWILKMATLRIGGTSLYERVTMKLAAGFFGGFLFGTIVGSIGSILRFLAPA